MYRFAEALLRPKGLRHLPGYTYYGIEGGTAIFSEKVDVAFGVDGKYKHIYGVQGNVALNNSTFGGDPVPGKKKVVYYRPSAPAGPNGYTFDVKENQTVLVPTLRNVAFGANGNFVYKYNRTADFTCNRASFNNQDPAPGVVKNCFVQLLNTPQGYDDDIRNENQTVNVSQPVNIAYGANGKFIFKYNVTSNLTCGNDAFGSDPIPGVAKKCYVRIR